MLGVGGSIVPVWERPRWFGRVRVGRRLHVPGPPRGVQPSVQSGRHVVPPGAVFRVRWFPQRHRPRRRRPVGCEGKLPRGRTGSAGRSLRLSAARARASPVPARRGRWGLLPCPLLQRRALESPDRAGGRCPSRPCGRGSYTARAYERVLLGDALADPSRSLGIPRAAASAPGAAGGRVLQRQFRRFVDLQRERRLGGRSGAECGAMLDECLASIERSMREIIVVDGNSTDCAGDRAPPARPSSPTAEACRQRACWAARPPPAVSSRWSTRTSCCTGLARACATGCRGGFDAIQAELEASRARLLGTGARHHHRSGRSKHWFGLVATV